MTVILASSSPRRRELLSRLGVPFRVVPSEVDEGPREQGEAPAEYALRLARTKAAEVARRYPVDVVLAADTVVALDGEILGKPDNPPHAVEMLMFLRGKTHLVATGVAAWCGGSQSAGAEQATVRMRAYSLAEAEEYVATGEPMDKAGAYAIQGLGSALVASMSGCYTAVVGLPLCVTARLLRTCGLEPHMDEAQCLHPGRSA